MATLVHHLHITLTDLSITEMEAGQVVHIVDVERQVEGAHVANARLARVLRRALSWRQRIALCLWLLGGF